MLALRPRRPHSSDLTTNQLIMDTRTGMILPEEAIPEAQKKHFVEVKRDLTVREKANAQIGLYEPCGCGSGKKFKFCCKK